MIETPTLPTASARRPAASRIDSSIRTVVVLPLVPVIINQSAAPSPRSRQANSSSPMTSIPRSAASANRGCVGGQPGEVTTSRVPSGTRATSPANVAPAATSSSIPSGCWRSIRTTRAPRASSARAAACPAKRAPQTTTVLPSRTDAPLPIGDEVGVEQPDAERDGHPTHDPEPDDDRDLLPPGEFEVVVQRGHPEDAAAGAGAYSGELEPAHLHDGRDRDRGEQAAERDQQQLGAGEDRQPGHQPAESERAGVPHEDLGRRRVPPQ